MPSPLPDPARIVRLVDKHEVDLRSIGDTVDIVREQVTAHTGTLADHTRRLGTIELKIDGLETKVGRLEVKVDGLETKVDQHTEMLGEILRRLPV